MNRRKAEEAKSYKVKVREYKAQLDDTKSTIRKLNVSVGKLERGTLSRTTMMRQTQQVQNVPEQATQSVADRSEYVQKHTALIEEIRRLQSDNEALKEDLKESGADKVAELVCKLGCNDRLQRLLKTNVDVPQALALNLVRFIQSNALPNQSIRLSIVVSYSIPCRFHAII
jgi:phage shock protein A